MSDVIDLFISYNRADSDWVTELAEQVESETFTGTREGRMLRVFLDQWDIEVGENFVEKLNDGLSRARYVAVILSPNYLEAPWPKFEWTHLVADDPLNRRRRLIPLFLRDGTEEGGNRVELPAPFRVLNWLDFRRKADFKPSYQKLIRRIRDRPQPRGRKRAPLAALPSPAANVETSGQASVAAPDSISEAILGNLLPVESFPSTIWFAPTEIRHAQEIFDTIKRPHGFELKKGSLYTFSDLSEDRNIFRKYVDVNGIDSNPVSDWQGDNLKWPWFVSLMNRCLKNHILHFPIRRDEKGRFFFLPKDKSSRMWQNAKDRPREVAAEKENLNTGDKFWVHHSAWLKFQNLGTEIYLFIEPSYVFTSDGYHPLQGASVGPLSMKWTGRERNAAFLRHIVFWARTLGAGETKITMDTGGLPIVVSGIPALARTNFGIEFDHIAIGTLIDQVEDELGLAASTVMLADQPGEGDDLEHEDFEER